MAKVILTMTSESVKFDFEKGKRTMQLSHADALRFSQDIVNGVIEVMEAKEENKSKRKLDKLMGLIAGLKDHQKNSTLPSDVDDFLCGMLADIARDAMLQKEKKDRAKESESEENLKDFYGTFELGQMHEGRYVHIKATSYEQADTEMRRRYGKNWSQLFPSKRTAGVDRNQLRELIHEETATKPESESESEAESEENLTDYYATFGSGQKHDKKYVTIKAVSMSAAIVKMTEHYGDNWSQMYPDKEEAGVDKYKLTEIFPE